MTVKLYDNDSHMRAFEAVVRTCRQGKESYAVELDQTAFFPEGGGQAADKGRLSNAIVLDVQEREGIIWHYTDRPLIPDTVVHGEIDWPVRFRRMQNHTGEHIVSGIIHREFGLNNVGFHMGADGVTVDLDGILTNDDLCRVEYLANEAVMRNVPVTATYPPADLLASMDYRSKLDLTENVRIVTIEGYDVCACCAPHVAHTGEIGLIKILSFMHHRGGIRLTMRCGFDALDDCNEKYDNILEISQALSAKQSETAQAVKRLKGELEEKKQEITALKKTLVTEVVNGMHLTDGNICIFQPALDMNSLRAIVNAGTQLCQGICAAFSGDDIRGYQYVMGSCRLDMRAYAHTLNEALHGRGGGSVGMVQGSVQSSRKEIERYFECSQNCKR